MCRRLTASSRFIVACLTAVLIVVGMATVGLAATPGTSSIIVKVAAGLSPDQVAAVIAADGGVEVSSVPALRLHVVEVADADLPAVIANYQSDPQVERVEQNQTRKVETIPSDPLYGDQWYLPKIGWDQAFGSWQPFGQATVAILDTGVDASHPDLAGNLVAGTSVIDGSGGTTDPNGHGTSLAGIVAAVSNNIGIAGVGFSGVSIMPVTVLGADGTGKDADIIAGILYAADHGASVILMGFSNAGFSQNLQDAIDYAWSKDVVLVAAVGNDAIPDPTYPAGDRGVMGVSSTDAGDALSVFSNYGKDVFIAAPGEGIVTTGLDHANYPTISGTSASSAIVAGVAAFLRAYDATLTNGAVVGRIASSADAAGNSTDQTGNGRINMAGALSDTSFNPVEPVGAPGGGPYIGPYAAAASTFQSVSVGSQTGSLTYGTGGNATYTVTVTRSGNGSLDVALSLTTALPTGATASFSPSTVSFTGGTPTSKNSTLTITTTSSTLAVNASSFTVQGADQNNNKKTNTGELTINKANQTITFGSLLNKTFGDPDFNVSGTASSGLGVTFTAAGNCTVSGNNVHITGAGSCTITAHQSGNSNYNAAPDVSQSFTVSPASLIITITDPQPTYDGTSKAATVATNPSGVAVTTTYKDANNNPVASPTDAGSYIVSSISADTNYSGSATGTLTIKPKTITVKADDKTITYGDASPTFTYSVTVGTVLSGDSLGTAGYTWGGLTTVPTTYNPGGYVIAVTGLANSNYAITTQDGLFTINQRAITVKAVTDSKTYDGTTSSSKTPTITFGSLATGDSATWTQAFDNKNVGTGNKTLIPAGSVNDGKGGNYLVTFANVTTGTISPLTITGSITAANKVYDGLRDATITGRYLAGVITADGTPDNVSLTGGTATFDTKDVGTGKTVTATGLALEGADKDNYTLFSSTAEAKANITPRTLNITAVTNTKTYDGNTSALAKPIYSGLQTGDTVTGLAETYDTTEAGTGKTLSVSAYTLDDGNNGKNYNVVTAVDNTGVINKVVLAVTANDAWRAFGAANPAFSVSYSGWVNSEDVSVLSSQPTASSTASATSSAGLYAITPTGGVSKNYSFNYVDGTLLVVPADITAIAGPSGYATVNYPAMVNNDKLGTVSFSPGSSSSFAPGVWPVVCSVTDLQGHAFAGSFRVLVPYKFGGFLNPVALGDTLDGKAFKQGSTIPVKFQLTDAGGNYCNLCSLNAAPKLYVYQLGQGNLVQAEDVESLPPAPADSGFRYDSTANQYIYNMSTKGTLAGCKFTAGYTYQIWATSSDGTLIIGTCRIYLK
jgi:subtilisin family serine protease